MPGKRGGGRKSTAKKPQEDLSLEKVLQAVVLCDHFSDFQYPVTDKMSPALLPVCNTPIIEYTLDWMQSHGVRQAILMTTNEKQLQHYLSHSKWKNYLCNFTDHLIGTPTHSFDIFLWNTNTYDCFAASIPLLEQFELNSPFVLIDGPVVANWNLTKAISDHKNRHNKDCIASLIFNTVEPQSTLSPSVKTDLIQYRIEAPPRYELLAWETSVQTASACASKHISSLPPPTDASARRSAGLPVECSCDDDDLEHINGLIREKKNLTLPVQLHKDTTKVRGDLCFSHVMLATDSFVSEVNQKAFDGSTVDSVLHILLSDVTNTYIAADIVDNGISCRVDSWRSYHALNCAVPANTFFPYSPFTNLVSPSSHITKYVMVAPTVFKEPTADVSSSTVLGPNTVTCSNSSLDAAYFSGILASGAKVMKGAVVVDSIVWPNVTIAENARITSSVICGDVKVEAGAVIPRGCIIGPDVVIKKSLHIPEFSLVVIDESTTKTAIRARGQSIALGRLSMDASVFENDLEVNMNEENLLLSNNQAEYRELPQSGEKEEHVDEGVECDTSFIDNDHSTTSILPSDTEASVSDDLAMPTNVLLDRAASILNHSPSDAIIGNNAAAVERASRVAVMEAPANVSLQQWRANGCPTGLGALGGSGSGCSSAVAFTECFENETMVSTISQQYGSSNEDMTIIGEASYLNHNSGDIIGSWSAVRRLDQDLIDRVESMKNKNDCENSICELFQRAEQNDILEANFKAEVRSALGTAHIDECFGFLNRTFLGYLVQHHTPEEITSGSLGTILDWWKGLLAHYLRVEWEIDSIEDGGKNILYEVHAWAVDSPKRATKDALSAIIYMLWFHDIVEDEVILEWNEELKFDKEDEECQMIIEKVSQIVGFIEQQAEESEGSSSEGYEDYGYDDDEDDNDEESESESED